MSFITHLKDTATEYGFLKELTQVTITLYPYDNLLHTSLSHNRNFPKNSVLEPAKVYSFQELENLDNICESCTETFSFYNNIVDHSLSDFFRAFYTLFIEITNNSNEKPNEFKSLEDLLMLSNYYSSESNEHSEDVMQAYFIMEQINSATANKVYLELVEYVNKKHRELLLDNPKVHALLKELNIDFTSIDEAEYYVAISPTKKFSEKELEVLPTDNWYNSVNRYHIGLAIASIFNRSISFEKVLIKAPLYAIKMIREYAPSTLVSNLYPANNRDVVLQAKQIWSNNETEVYFSFDKAYEAITLV